MATLFFSIFTNLLMLTGPLFMLQVYDRVLGSRSEETLVALFLLVAILYTFYGVLEYARGRVMARAGARVQSAMSARVFRAVMKRSALKRSQQTGSHALQDLDSVRLFFASPVALSLFDMPWTPLFLMAIFIFHPYLGWLALAGGGLLIVAAFLNQAFTQKRIVEAQSRALGATQFARTSEAGADYLWAQGMTDAMAQRWIALQNRAGVHAMTASDWTGTFAAFSRAFRLFLQSAMLALGAWLVLQSEVTAGAMIAASILLGRALAPIEQGIGQWPVAQRARAGWRSLDAFLREVPQSDAQTELPAPMPRVSVNKVTVVAQPGEPPVLSGISFDVEPGQVLGIIGKSGSGKTTLARMLAGLMPPSTGDVRIGGATLDQYGPKRLGAHIGYLPQDVVLFDGTIAENIAQMSQAPDAGKVIAAAKRAHVHDVILQLPDGYDTRLGQMDARLSGGQRQRLALARALYRDPVVLILDEPNSALDAEGSEALNAAVMTMKSEGKAVIIMTHRPTAISTCDRLLVLDAGKVVAQGPRDEIIKSMMRNSGDVQRVVATGARA